MNILRKTHNFLALHLSKQSKFDGRFLIGLILSIYFAPILIGFFLTGSYEKLVDRWWIFPGVPKKWPSFGDLRVITAGYECYRLGYEPRIENPCYPHQPPLLMNYPKIWLSLASFGINQSHTVLIGTIIAFLFFMFIFLHIKRVNYAEALIYSAVLCSPPIMLGVERGNNDLIIYSLLSISLIFAKSQQKLYRIFSFFTFLLAAFLKLYPVFCFTVYLKERKNNLVFITSLVIGIFSIYSIYSLDDLKLVSQATPRPEFWSYGYKIIFHFLRRDLKKMENILWFNKTSLDSLLPVGIYPIIIKILWLIFIIACFILIVFMLKNIKQQHYSFDVENKEFIDAFRVGASVYIGSFLIGNNWAYRLIFLIFTLPQIFVWIKHHDRLGMLSSLSLGCLLLNLWLKMIGNWSPTYGEILCMYFSQLIDWFLLFYFLYILLLTCPDWLKAKLSFIR